MGRIGNVVFDAPGATLEEYGRSAGAIARMYAESLGMRCLTRGDWYRESGWPADGGDDVDPARVLSRLARAEYRLRVRDPRLPSTGLA